MNPCSACLQPFVVKKHRATRLHYDFRLGWNGVLKSWAMPDGPSCCAAHRREAIEMDDHSREHLAFEGVIPAGRPGSGPTMPWDLGMWEPLPAYREVDGSLRKGCLVFTLHGEKLKGNWRLIRRPGARAGRRRPVWDLIKEPDAFARSETARNILDEAPASIRSGKTLEEVERDWREGSQRPKSGAMLFEL